LLRQYVRDRLPNEKLRGFFSRHSDDDLRAVLAGGEIASVPRDLPTGHVPHGIEGS